MTATFNHDAFNKYGVRETAPINSALHAVREAVQGSVQWDDPDLKCIVRLRLLSDPGYPAWDVSYCWGQLKNGVFVDVELPFSQLPKRGFMSAIIRYAQKDGVYAKGLGVFDAISTLC